MAPLQLGKFHVSLKLFAISFHWSSVCGVCGGPEMSHIASQVSLIMLNTVVLVSRYLQLIVCWALLVERYFSSVAVVPSECIWWNCHGCVPWIQCLCPGRRACSIRRLCDVDSLRHSINLHHNHAFICHPEVINTALS